MAFSEEVYRDIYQSLDEVSPMAFDCGKLCSAACCGCTRVPEDQQDDMGIFLLPGEEQMLVDDADWLYWWTGKAEDFFFPYSWRGTDIYFVRCKDPFHCHRKKRSIQCRTFPVTPHLLSSGRLSLVFNDLELPYLCPLIEEGVELEPDFLHVTWEAWNELIRDPLIYDYVSMDSDNRRPDLEPEDILYTE